MKTSINWFYLGVALLFVSMLYVSSRFFKGSGNSSVGIAKAKEYKINAEKSSVIVAVRVVSGQQVKANDILIELSSPDLEMEIEKLTSRIAVLKSELSEKLHLAQSEIAFVRAENEITLEEIDTDIQQIKSEMELNERLSKEFAAKSDTSKYGLNPQQIKLKSLTQQKTRHQQAIEIKIKDIKQESITEQNQLANQIKLLEREFDLLLGERKKLVKSASTDGVVENIYVKEGEQVDAFTQLLSLVPLRPTTVIGYLVGKKYNIPQMDDSVMITAYEQRSMPIVGTVIGYGSVTELPEILQKSTATKAFGREVYIEIPAGNDFANGEKVLIR